MAAPTPTTRQTPVGRVLKDGHPSKITFAADPDVSFWEKSLTPGGFDGGDAIDLTTFFNVTYRRKTPRSLIDLTACSGTCLYDPNVITQIDDLINVETTVTITFKDGTTWAEYGWLKSFTPQEMTEGEPPMADFEVELSGWDNTNNVEAGPAVASIAGT